MPSRIVAAAATMICAKSAGARRVWAALQTLGARIYEMSSIAHLYGLTALFSKIRSDATVNVSSYSPCEVCIRTTTL